MQWKCAEEILKIPLSSLFSFWVSFFSCSFNPILFSTIWNSTFLIVIFPSSCLCFSWVYRAFFKFTSVVHWCCSPLALKFPFPTFHCDLLCMPLLFFLLLYFFYLFLPPFLCWLHFRFHRDLFSKSNWYLQIKLLGNQIIYQENWI